MTVGETGSESQMKTLILEACRVEEPLLCSAGRWHRSRLLAWALEAGVPALALPVLAVGSAGKCAQGKCFLREVSCDVCCRRGGTWEQDPLMRE